MSPTTPTPEACTTTEASLTLPDNHTLYTKTWTPTTPSPPRARLLWLHGFSDHCNWYDALFRFFCAEGIAVHSFDQRGWGRSVRHASQRGLTGGTEKVVADIAAFVGSVLEGEGGGEVFLGGHSMGGGEALAFMARGPEELVRRVRGVVLEAPFLAQPPATRASAVVVKLGKAASWVVPGRQMVQKIDRRIMSRDEDVCEAWERDELCHDTGTLEGLRGMLERGEELLDGRAMVRDIWPGGLGVWVGHGSGDQVADLRAVRRWFEGLQVVDKRMVVFEGWFHKLHCEPGEDKVRFAREVREWILERCGDGAGGRDAVAGAAEERSKL